MIIPITDPKWKFAGFEPYNPFSKLMPSVITNRKHN